MKVKLFHGSYDCFDEILLHKCCDLGFHCGTLEQALYRILDTNKCYTETFFKSFVYELNLDIDDKEVIDLPDCISWADIKTVKEKIIEKYPFLNIEAIQSTEKLREYFLKLNIRYIRYENKIEGNGYSYILLDENAEFERYTVREMINKISENYGKC